MAREMTPQERAAALLEKCMKMGWAFNGSYTEGQGHYVLAQALKTARQEALREAKEVAKSELRNTMILASCPGQSSAAWNIMWKLDRLASEGA